MRNRFLDSLSALDLAAITPDMARMSCCAGEKLGSAGISDSHVFFPLSLVASFALPSRRCGIGMVGREGVIGWEAILGLAAPNFEARVLFDGGTMLAMSVSKLRNACFSRPTLSMSLLRFVQRHSLQLGCLANSGVSANIPQRVGAWLLMLHDRIDGDFIAITHSELADQLDIRRASVTEALHLLEGDGAVGCKRGQIFIRDRETLEIAADFAYHRRSSYRPRIKGSPHEKRGGRDCAAMLRRRLVE
ncbi:Crp/Fnr family transcriptional regulator [Qipengyuania sp. JC766]|uniref:Crp/Fnr family transcriptional regulator n=1 Tax=Qipengyuania sp. JC766 TaxID=3232139 RepID=UPI0034587A64